jgi:hypothetical protein
MVRFITAQGEEPGRPEGEKVERREISHGFGVNGEGFAIPSEGRARRRGIEAARSILLGGFIGVWVQHNSSLRC